MSSQSSISQVVVSYITAMHAWETQTKPKCGHGDGAAGDCGLSTMDLVEWLEEMLDSGEMDAVMAARQRILNEHCTSRELCSRGGWGWGPSPKHHPELEHVIRVQQVADGQAHVWTDYTDDQDLRTQRRYELQFCDGVWLIDQHYILSDGEEYPEIY